MIWYDSIMPTLLVGIFLIALMASSGDEEVTEKPVNPVEPEPTEVNEDLIGTWGVETINDGHPLLFLVEDEPDKEDRPKITINQFIYDFAEDRTWTSNLKAEMTDFPEAPPNEAGEEQGKIEIKGMWSGTYSIQETLLTLTVTKKDLGFTSVPEEFFEIVFDVKKVVAQQELTDEFNSNIFTPFEKTLVSIEDDTLALQPAGSENSIIIKKQ